VPWINGDHHWKARSKMPYIISREAAIAELKKQKPEQECLICWLQQQTDNLTIESTEHTSVILSKCPARWGHLMVLIHPHFINYTELPASIWTAAAEKAQKAAIVLETVLKPVRCYVISAGTSRSDLQMSSPHLHFNVIPVYEQDDKPSTVLTWKNGVYSATEEEWSELQQSIQQEWNSL
jgi:diadenosine tetraphosphate (Ap4A) HIT family hydrolase